MKFFIARKEPGNRTIELSFSQKHDNLSSIKSPGPDDNAAPPKVFCGPRRPAERPKSGFGVDFTIRRAYIAKKAFPDAPLFWK